MGRSLRNGPTLHSADRRTAVTDRRLPASLDLARILETSATVSRCAQVVALAAQAGLGMACSVEIDAAGSRFACREPPYACPDGFRCVGGECVDEASAVPDPGTAAGADA